MQIHTLLFLLSKCKNSSINRTTLFKWIEMKDKIKTLRVWTFLLIRRRCSPTASGCTALEKRFDSLISEGKTEGRQGKGPRAARPEVGTTREFTLVHSHFRLPGSSKRVPVSKNDKKDCSRQKYQIIKNLIGVWYFLKYIYFLMFCAHDVLKANIYDF